MQMVVREQFSLLRRTSINQWQQGATTVVKNKLIALSIRPHHRVPMRSHGLGHAAVSHREEAGTLQAVTPES